MNDCTVDYRYFNRTEPCLDHFVFPDVGYRYKNNISLVHFEPIDDEL